MAWQHISPEVNVNGPMQWMGLMTICCRMTVKTVTVVLIGKGK